MLLLFWGVPRVGISGGGVGGAVCGWGDITLSEWKNWFGLYK